MFETPLKAYLLHGGVEPARDVAAARAGEALRKAAFVIALTPFADEGTRSYAHVMLPIGTFGETSGTFVNFEGRWQSFAGAAKPVGDARPGWKVLRVLANLAGLSGFEYTSSDQVRDELRALIAEKPDASFASQRMLNGETPPQGSLSDVPMYAIDALVRRAPALQRTRDAQMRSELT